MDRFLFKAKKGPSEVLEGNIEADSETAAVNRLLASGCHPIWIREAPSAADRKSKGAFFSNQRVAVRDLANFTRQLLELVDSGLALFDALNIIETQTTHPYLKEIIGTVRDRIKQGSTFSESLASHPHIFSNLYVSLVRAGEAAGALSEALSNISDFLDKEALIRSRIRVALAYPALMAAVGIVTIFILMAFVIPRLASVFVEMGEVLPLSTRIIIGLSDFVRRFWILLVVLAGGGIFFIKSTDGSGRAVSRLPIISALVKDVELARFSRTLSMLLKSGVPILYSLKITSEVAANEAVRQDIRRIYEDVKSGSSLSAAIKSRPSFPQFVVNMTTVGEEAGHLDKMLLRVAKSYETETDRTIKVMSSLLEPVLILAMGLVVGFIVISMLLPVFQISLVAH